MFVKNELIKAQNQEIKEQSIKKIHENEDLDNTVKIDLNVNTVMELKDDNALQAEKNMVANIERFVTRLRMMAHLIIQTDQVQKSLDEEEFLSEPYLEIKFDPDSDGFEFGLKEATELHFNVNILQFLRKNLGLAANGKAKQFDQNIEKLSLRFIEERSIIVEESQMPDF